MGIEAAQLLALAGWLGKGARLETYGVRSQVTALVAAALSPGSFSDIESHDGIDSLSDLLETPVRHPDAPDLFCFGLLRHFDIDRLVALASD